MGGVQSGPYTKYPARQENRLLPVLQTYAFVGSSQGKRDTMEDRDVIAVLDDEYFSYIQFFAIFDGHGGTTVSQAASKLLAKHITAHMLIACRQMETIFGHYDLSYQQTIKDMHVRSKAKQPGVFSCGKNVDYIENDPNGNPRLYDDLYHPPSHLSQIPQQPEPISPHGKTQRRQVIETTIPQITFGPPTTHTTSPRPRSNSLNDSQDSDDQNNNNNNASSPTTTTTEEGDNDNNTNYDEGNQDEPTPDHMSSVHEQPYELFPKRQIKLPTLANQRDNDSTKLPQPNTTIYATKQTTMPQQHLVKSAEVLANRGIPPYLHKCLYWHTRYDILRSQLIHNAVTEAFVSFDLELMNRYSTNSVNTGTTAVILLVDTLHGTVFSANVGDSRAILSRNGTAVPLSQIHAPALPTERDRIREQGLDVLVNRVNGSLAISRALGDGHLKSSSVAAASHAHTVTLERDANTAKPSNGKAGGSSSSPSGHSSRGKGKSSERSEQEKMTNLLGLIRRPFHNCKPWKNACSPIPFTLSTAVSSLAKDQFIVLGCDGLFDCLSEQSVVDWVVSRFRQVAVRALCNAHIYSYTPSTARLLDGMVKGRIQSYADYRDKLFNSTHTSHTYPHVDQQAQLEQRYEWALTQPSSQEKLLTMFNRILVDRSTAIMSENGQPVTSQQHSTQNDNLTSKNTSVGQFGTNNSNISLGSYNNNNANTNNLISPLTPLTLTPHEFNQQLSQINQFNPNPAHSQIKHHITNAVPYSADSTTYTKPLDIPWHLLGIYSPLDFKESNRERSIMTLNMKQHAQIHQEAQQEQYGVRIWGQTGSTTNNHQPHLSKPKRNTARDGDGRGDDKSNKDSKAHTRSGGKNSSTSAPKEANYGLNSQDYAEQASANVLNAAKGCLFCGSDLLRQNRLTSLIERQRGLKRLQDEHQSTQIHLLYSTAQSIFNKIKRPHFSSTLSSNGSLHFNPATLNREHSNLSQPHNRHIVHQRFGSGDFKPGLLLRENSNLTHFTHRSVEEDNGSSYDGPMDPSSILGIKLVHLYEQRPLFEMFSESDFQAQNHYNNSNGGGPSQSVIADYFEKLTTQKIRADPGFVCPHCDYINGFPLLPAVTPHDHFSAYVLPQYDLDINSTEDLLKSQQDILLSDARYLAILPKHRLEKEREDKEKAEKLAFQQQQILLAQQQLLLQREERDKENNNVVTAAGGLRIDPEIENPSPRNANRLSTASPRNNGPNRSSVSSIPQLQQNNSSTSHSTSQFNLDTGIQRSNTMAKKNSVASVGSVNGSTMTVLEDSQLGNQTPYQLSAFPSVPPANLFKQLVAIDLGSQAKIQIQRYIPSLSSINNNSNYRMLNEKGKRIVKIPYSIHNNNLRARSFEYPLRHVPQRHLYTNDPISTSLKLQDHLHQRYLRFIKHTTATKLPVKQPQQTQQPHHQTGNRGSLASNGRGGRLNRLPSPHSPQHSPSTPLDQPANITSTTTTTTTTTTIASTLTTSANSHGCVNPTFVPHAVPPPSPLHSNKHPQNNHHNHQQPFSLGRSHHQQQQQQHNSHHNADGSSLSIHPQLCHVGLYHLGVEAITQVISNLTPSCTTVPLIPRSSIGSLSLNPHGSSLSADLDYVHSPVFDSRTVLSPPESKRKPNPSSLSSGYGQSALPTNLTFNNKTSEKNSSTGSSAFASPAALVKIIKCPVSNDTVFPAAFRREFVGIETNTIKPTTPITNTFSSPHHINVFIIPNSTIDSTDNYRAVLARSTDEGWESLSVYEGKNGLHSDTNSNATPASHSNSILSHLNFSTAVNVPTVPNFLNLFIANGLVSHGTKTNQFNPEVSSLVCYNNNNNNNNGGSPVLEKNNNNNTPEQMDSSAPTTIDSSPSQQHNYLTPYIGKSLLKLPSATLTDIVTKSSSLLHSFCIVNIQLSLFAHDYVVSMRNRHIAPVLFAMMNNKSTSSSTRLELVSPNTTQTQSTTTIQLTLSTESSNPPPNIIKSEVQSFQSFLQSRETSVDLSGTTIRFALDESKQFDALQTTGTFHNNPCNFIISSRQFPVLHYSNEASALYGLNTIPSVNYQPFAKQPKSTTNRKTPRGARIFTFDQPSDSTEVSTAEEVSQSLLDEVDGGLYEEVLDEDGESKKKEGGFGSSSMLKANPLKVSKSGQQFPLFSSPAQSSASCEIKSPSGNTPTGLNMNNDNMNMTDNNNKNNQDDDNVIINTHPNSNLSTPQPNSSSPHISALPGSNTAPLKPSAFPPLTTVPSSGNLTSTASFSLGGGGGGAIGALNQPQLSHNAQSGTAPSSYNTNHDFGVLAGQIKQTYYADLSKVQKIGVGLNQKTNTTRIYSIVAFFPHRLSGCSSSYAPPRSEGRNITKSKHNEPAINNLSDSNYHFRNAIEISSVEHNINLILSADLLCKENKTTFYEQIFIFSNVPDLLQSHTHPHIFLVPYQIAPLFTHVAPHEHKAATDLFSQNPLFFEIGITPSSLPSENSSRFQKPPTILQQSLYHSTFPITTQSIEEAKKNFQYLEANTSQTNSTHNANNHTQQKAPYNPESLLIPILRNQQSFLTTGSQSSFNGGNGGSNNYHFEKFVEKFRSHQHIWLSMYISHLFYQQSQYQHSSCHQNLITTVTPLDICQKPTPRPLPDIVDTIGYTTELDLASYCLFQPSFHPNHPTNQLEESRRTTKPRVITTEKCTLDEHDSDRDRDEGLMAGDVVVPRKDSNSNQSDDGRKLSTGPHHHHHHSVRIVDDGSDDKINPALPKDHSAKTVGSTESFNNAIQPINGNGSIGGDINGIHRLPNDGRPHTHQQQQIMERERYHQQQEMFLNKRDPKAFKNHFGSSLHNICYELIERALAAGSKDNISTIILFFRFPLVEDVIYSLENDNGQIDEIWDTSRKYLQYDEEEEENDENVGEECDQHIVYQEGDEIQKHPGSQSPNNDGDDLPVQLH